MNKKSKLIKVFIVLLALIFCAESKLMLKNQAVSVSAADTQKSASNGEYQIDQKFPIKEDEENDEFDSWSLLNNITRKFYGFSGQGEVSVYTNSRQSFCLFINGRKVDLKGIKHEQWTTLSIGKLTKNGNNSLQISRIKFNSPTDTFQIRVPYPSLVNCAQTKANLSNDSFRLMDMLISNEIKYGFSSAQVVVVHNGKIVKQRAYGTLNSYSEEGKRIKAGSKVTNSTLYDLASNTKMYATNFALQKLVSEKKLDLNSRVSDIFPNFKDQADDEIKGKSNLTIREILQHQAGFPADPQYHNNNYDPSNSTQNRINANPVYTQNREQILEKIIATPLDYQPGTKTVYSDVDYMILGLIIEKITGQREDEYVENSIYKPLGLTHTVYNPLQKGFTKNQISASELNGNSRDHTITFNNIREHTIQGEVHDEKAFYTMQGVSGHAGLFSNATDIAVLAQTVINRGGYGNFRVFNEDTLDEFIKPKSTDSSYGLGWRRKGSGNYAWAFSNLSDASAVGHTGWTGTLTVVDPHDNTAVVLLTNERNTPIMNAKKTPNDFIGGHYLVAKYGDIVNLAFSGINRDSKSANDSKLINLVLQRYNQIAKKPVEQTVADRQDLSALYTTLEARGKSSKKIKEFIQSRSGQEIKQLIK